MSQNSENQQSNDASDDLGHLFARVPIGSQADGKEVINLEWDAGQIQEAIGIEALVGRQGFRDADGFYRWMQATTNSPLADWEGVEVTLYEAWFWYGDDWELSADEVDFCYWAWRVDLSSDVLHSRAHPVYALRHKAWTLLEQRRSRAFGCARGRSYVEAEFHRKNPEDATTPQVMLKSSFPGVMLTGRQGKAATETVLCWPTINLREVIILAKDQASTGAYELTLWEGGMGFMWDDFTEQDIKALLSCFDYYGEHLSLHDLMINAGMLG